MPTDPTFVLVFLDDVDALCDAFGRRVGDELVSVVAERLRQAAGADDRVVPLGVDTFAVRCERPSVAASLALALALPVVIQEWAIPVHATFRVGTARLLPRDERAPRGEEGGVVPLEPVA